MTDTGTQWNGMDWHGANWTAVLAPLGVAGDDGRALAAALDLGWSCPLPLREDTPAAPVVGVVVGVRVAGGQITAHGSVADAAAAMRMSCGELRPQITLDRVQCNDDGAITAGTLREVRAGEAPIWPVCRFTLT